MSVGDARFGRRDNGLRARAYAAAGDVDPRVGEHLLDLLAQDGIAAFLRPSSDLHPVTRSTTVPTRPTDRLYVDRDHLDTARDHLARLAREEGEAVEALAVGETGAADDRAADDRAAGDAPQQRRLTEPTSDEVERAFAEIVAGYGRTARGEPRPRIVEDEPPRRRERQPEPEEPGLLDALDTFGADLPDDDTEGFVPPEPPPMPKPSLATVLAVVGVIGGLVVFLKPSLLSFLNENLAMFIGFTGLVTGFGMLVWRLRSGDDDETGTDDGARV